VFTKPTIYTASEKKTTVINLFNYNELQWKEWTATSMALHQTMINSIGALNLATIERLSGHARRHPLIIVQRITWAHHRHVRLSARRRRVLH
jgi:hypothetical protein